MNCLQQRQWSDLAQMSGNILCSKIAGAVSTFTVLWLK